MEKVNDPQLELFSQQVSGVPKKALPRGSFLGQIRAYEKAVLIIIGFITISIISFSLGVEKGRKMASSNILMERAAVAVPAQPVVAAVAQKQETVLDRPQSLNTEAETVVKKEPVNDQKAGKNYTIQVASYKVKTYAQKEADILKNKGLSPLFLNKGNYVVLCVGNFVSRSAAESLLTELKKQKRYSGCLIRRL